MITVDQHEYVRNLDTVHIPRERKQRLNSPLVSREITQLRQLTGKLAWPTRETCPQLAFLVSELQQSVSGATVSTLMQANLVAKRARRLEKERFTSRFGELDLSRACVVTFSDASFANMPRGGSQGGAVSFLSEEGVGMKDVPATIIEWKSHRIKRVVKSTLAAEAAALAEAQDKNEYARVLFQYLMGRMNSKEWQQALEQCPGYLAIDAKSVYDLVHKDGSMPSEKRVGLDLMAVQEGLKRPQDDLRWVPTRHMLADPFTKYLSHAPYFDYVLSSGRLSLVESEEAKAIFDDNQRTST